MTKIEFEIKPKKKKYKYIIKEILVREIHAGCSQPSTRSNDITYITKKFKLLT